MPPLGVTLGKILEELEEVFVALHELNQTLGFVLQSLILFEHSGYRAFNMGPSNLQQTNSLNVSLLSVFIHSLDFLVATLIFCWTSDFSFQFP